ncbi:hypothetical protein M8J77_017135 [Diaphorina citri]|nr:hypothetical protein M8J77_017135 [Diaphorina citri]
MTLLTAALNSYVVVLEIRMEEHYDVEMKSDRESTICMLFMLVCRVRIHNAIHSDSEVKRKFQASPV